MTTLGRLIAVAAICALPLAASAQSATPTDKSSTTKVVPGEQPAGTNPDQKTRQDTGEAPKNGQSGSQSGPEPLGATTDKDLSKSKTKTKRPDKMDKSDQGAPGDSTTYPAKTKDGRSTGDSNAK